MPAFFSRFPVRHAVLLPLLCLFLAMGRLASPADAATLAVPGQYTTIQAAITAAANGDTVLVADGTYTGDGNVDIDFSGKNITVMSQNGPANTIIDCQGSSAVNHRGFYLASGETGAVIRGFTVKNGYSTNGGLGRQPNDGSGGGIFIASSTPGSSVTVQNCIITNCAVGTGEIGGSGGGVYADVNASGAASTVSLINCTIANNTAPYYGGGVYADSGYNGGAAGGAITMTGCTFSGNNAGWTANAIASGATVTDVLWTNTNGMMAGYRYAANSTLTTQVFGPYTGWGAYALSVGPDDIAHPMWDNSDGHQSLWSAGFMGGGITSTLYGPFSGWYAQAVATGPDNVSHLLWNHNPDNQASLWSIPASGGFTSKQYGPYPGWQAVAVSAGP